MNIQIFGKSKCFDTKKAERYFKERKIKYQYIDILRYGLSKGEMESVRNAVGLENIIDNTAKEYAVLNLQYIKSAAMREEILVKNPRLYQTPIVRNGRCATVGFKPEVWKDWQ
jgi:arsenate reductase (glutaredoxin)